MSDSIPPDGEILGFRGPIVPPAPSIQAAAEPAAPALPERIHLTPEIIRAAFRQRVRPYTRGGGGGPGALSVLLVPPVYFFIIAGLLYCVAILSLRTKPELSKEGLPTIRGFLAWFAPIAAGVVMLYYMVKPLFRKQTPPNDEVEVSRADQPLLFTFVEEIVRVANVPMPAYICVDCGSTVRASLAKSGDLRHVQTSLKLTIGLSALYASSLRKLAAAICCELGRFRVEGAPAYRVQRVAEWLTRVVTYRGAFDDTLEEMSEKENKILRMLGVFLRWMVRMMRGTLDGLLAGVSIVGREALRQAQFQSDFSAAQLSGPIEFNALLMQSYSLRVTKGIAERNLRRTINDSLPANFGAFVAESQNNIPQEVRQPFQEQIEHEDRKRVHLGATRTERMGNISNVERVPLLNLDGPAESLLAVDDDLSEHATIRHYQQVYGEEYRRAWIRPNPEFFCELGYSLFRPDSRDTMIDYHEGDKWYKWRRRLSTISGILMTIGLVVHAGNQIARASESEETKFRRNIGRDVLVYGGDMREIKEVKFANRGDVVTYETEGDPDSAITAPSTGWYYDTGEGYIVKCREALVRDEEATGEEDSEMKQVLDQMKQNSDDQAEVAKDSSEEAQ